MNRIALLALVGFLAAPTTASAQGTVTLYCPVVVDWCQAAGTTFERETGTKVRILQKSAGEVLAQVRAEASNPKGDVWWNGLADGHLIAAEEGLTIPHEPSVLGDLHPWARKINAESKGHATGTYGIALGFGYNPEILARKKLAAPRCWADLIKPEYRGEVQMANPNSSGTGYAVIATLVQLMGEEPAFDYLKKLHANVNSYARSGVGPAKAVARGETGISISFMQDVIVEKNAGFPAEIAAPCEGTALGIDAMSIIKGAPNLAGARRFADWALGPVGQATGAKIGQMHTAANRAVPEPSGSPEIRSARFIDYDFRKYGSSAERKRLLARWEAEINSLPR